MSKLCLLFILVFPFFNRSFSPRRPQAAKDDSLLSLKQHIVKDILTASMDPDEVASIASKINADGSWSDIDYTDKTRGGWPVNLHNERLNGMAVLFTRPGTKWAGDPKLAQQIMRGLDYWLQHDFICPNWWYPEIGVPKVLGPTMILMEDLLTAAQKEAGVRILNRAKIGMTGQNKVWLSGNVIYRSVLTGDLGLINSAVNAIQEEVVVSEAEGIQPDFSFHQHGTQQQFGNYGSAYAGDILKWASIFQGTPFQFRPEKVDILRNYLLNGMRWIVWKNKMDISACGRQLFPDAQAGKAASIRRIFRQMPVVDPANTVKYNNALNDFEGDVHFWKSDMTVHRRNNFYTSVKMSSNRVGGAESCNDENLQGYHLGDGATYFYQSNKEYTDIFPYWDWKMIPGTTAFHGDKPLPVLPCSGYNLQTDFVGGVSDGKNGIATLSYKRDSLVAQKSWFFFENAVICLGAGIHTDEEEPVVTTVNQSFLHGKVLVKQGGAVQSLSAGQHALSGPSWVLHDGWGYYFPGSQAVQLCNQVAKGDWHRVLKRMPEKEIKDSLFLLWFDHHAKPDNARYAYYVLPAATQQNIESRASGFQLLQNTSGLQAVECNTLQMLGIVFVQPATCSSPLYGDISTKQPCIVLLTKKGGVCQLVVSEPTHKVASLQIGLKGKHTAPAGSARYEPAKNMTWFTIALPQGPDAGRSVQLEVK